MNEVKEIIREEAQRAKKHGLTFRQFLFCEFIKIFFGLNFCYWAIVFTIIFFEKN